MIKRVLPIIVIFFTSTLFINSYTYAFHENLGIDDNRASELYRTNPNDPAIAQWKTALQSEINDMDRCFDIQTAFLCENKIPIIISHCVSHPNTLLACNDSRFPQFPTILKLSQEEQKKAEEKRKLAAIAQEEEMKETHYSQIQTYGSDMLDKCFIWDFNATAKFEVAGQACDLEMRSLQGECNLVNNTYNYCKDERFVGFLMNHNLLNSTAQS